MLEEIEDEVSGLEDDRAGGGRGGLFEALRRRNRDRKKKLDQAKKLEKAAIKASRAARILATITAWIAGNFWIFILLIVVPLVLIGLYLAFQGFIASIWCQVTPSPCGRNAGVSVNEQYGPDANLQGKILALATKQITPKMVRPVLDEVERETRRIIDNAQKNNHPDLAKLKQIKSAVDSKIGEIRPLVVSDDQLTGAQITNVKTKLRELAQVVGQFETLGLAIFFGESTMPLRDGVRILGFNSTLHRRSVQRQFNRSDDNGHRVFLGYGDDEKGCLGPCKGDAVDVSVKAGTEVIAPFSGTVSVNSEGTRNENVTIKASSQKTTALTAHIRATVVDGQKVSVGQIIGYVGGFPKWTSHLHFELWINGQSIHHDAGTPMKKPGLGGELWSKMRLILDKD